MDLEQIETNNLKVSVKSAIKSLRGGYPQGPREIASVELSICWSHGSLSQSNLLLVITRNPSKEGWWARIIPSGEEHLLKSKDLDDAKVEAIGMLSVWISNLSKALEKLES